jgi:hypothetical protein
VMMMPVMAVVMMPAMMVVVMPVVMMVAVVMPVVMMAAVVMPLMVMMVVPHLTRQAFLTNNGLRPDRSRRCWCEESCGDERGCSEDHFHKHLSYSPS